VSLLQQSAKKNKMLRFLFLLLLALRALKISDGWGVGWGIKRRMAVARLALAAGVPFRGVGDLTQRRCARRLTLQQDPAGGLLPGSLGRAPGVPQQSCQRPGLRRQPAFNSLFHLSAHSPAPAAASLLSLRTFRVGKRRWLRAAGCVAAVLLSNICKFKLLLSS